MARTQFPKLPLFISTVSIVFVLRGQIFKIIIADESLMTDLEKNNPKIYRVPFNRISKALKTSTCNLPTKTI